MAGSSPRHFPFSGVGSLLLSDIAGFSSTASEIPALELFKVMGRIITAEHHFIHESHGFMPYTRVTEVVLAVWGLSGSRSSHADLAVKTAKKILAEARTVQAETGFSLQVRVAVTTGEMTVDTIGGRTQVFGAPFSTAQRLLELAAPHRSQLLYTSETLELTYERRVSAPIATTRGCSGQDVPVFEFTL